jgi:hypothetical protein
LYSLVDFPRRSHGRRRSEKYANGVPRLTVLVISGSRKTINHSFNREKRRFLSLEKPLKRADHIKTEHFPNSQSWRNDFPRVANVFRISGETAHFL